MWDTDQDAQLMLDFQSGSETAFERLVTLHRVGVCRLIWGIVRNEAVAEELTQETFLRVHLSRERYEPRCRFRTWLYTIATNLSLNWIRDNRRQNESKPLDDRSEGKVPTQIPDPAPLIEDQLARTQWQHRKRAKVQVAIRALPERQRKAVELRVWNGMAYEQIASTLGCTQMSVKALLFRAHTNLREKLAGAVA